MHKINLLTQKHKTPITEKVDQDNVFEPNKRVKLGVKSIAEKAAKEQQKVIANEDIDDSSDGI